MGTMVAVVGAGRDLEHLREEFESLPGLRLTGAQAARLLDVDREGAARLLERLAAEGLLVCGIGGVYRRVAPLMA